MAENIKGFKINLILLSKFNHYCLW